jgi:hypothetical protein
VIAFVGGGLYDQGSYLPAAAPAAAQSFAVSEPIGEAEPLAATQEGLDPTAAAFASLAAEQQATGDGATRKKQAMRTV